MKKMALLLALVAVLIVPVNAFSATWALRATPRLTFDGTTATCKVTVVGNGTSEYIEVNLELMDGDTCIASWYSRGYGYVEMQKTKEVTPGKTYTLIAEITVNAIFKDPVSVTATCSPMR